MHEVAGMMIIDTKVGLILLALWAGAWTSKQVSKEGEDWVTRFRFD
jgi:hypothetical protein